MKNGGIFLNKIFGLGIFSLIALMLVFSGCTTGQAGEGAKLAATIDPSTTALINANACNRDEVCEIQSTEIAKHITNKGNAKLGLAQLGETTPVINITSYTPDSPGQATLYGTTVVKNDFFVTGNSYLGLNTSTNEPVVEIPRQPSPVLTKINSNLLVTGKGITFQSPGTAQRYFSFDLSDIPDEPINLAANKPLILAAPSLAFRATNDSDQFHFLTEDNSSELKIGLVQNAEGAVLNSNKNLFVSSTDPFGEFILSGSSQDSVGGPSNLVLVAPNGSKWKVLVSNSGQLSTALLEIEHLCGNGQLNAGEQCDGVNLAGATCQALGYQSGTLLCTSDCTYDTSQCISP